MCSPVRLGLRRSLIGSRSANSSDHPHCGIVFENNPVEEGHRQPRPRRKYSRLCAPNANTPEMRPFACSTKVVHLRHYARMHRTEIHIQSRKPEQRTQPILVSKREAAALLGVCLRSIDNYIMANELPCRRFGRRVLIPYKALVVFASRDHLPPVGESAVEPEN
jgi:excisionase family DNA binding protein